MIPQINILCVVDVISALSSGSLRQTLFMVDNHPANSGLGVAERPPGGRPSQGIRSVGLGSAALTTHATYGQVLNWHVIGVDFQAEIQISGITFFRDGQPLTEVPCARLGRYGAPSGDYWAGIVDAPERVTAGNYAYKIEFSMSGRRLLMDDFATITVLR